MKASQLRDLTRKFAAGNMERQAYIAERTRLIDGMVKGEIEIRYRELDPLTKAPRQGGQKHWLFAGGSVMLVGLLLVALLFHFLDDGSVGGEQPAAAVAPAPEPGVVLLQEFLRQDDWSEASVQQLESGWNGLSAFQQESARRSAGYRRLRHEIAQRITEQEALLAAGEMEALLRAKRLRDFAGRLGIDP